jgi:hypothetical protein
MAHDTDFAPLSAGQARSRVRISGKLLGALNWKDHVQDFDCIGFFRTPGELIVAPEWLVCDNGEHPLGTVFEFERPPSTNVPVPLDELPPARVLLAPSRICRFSAKWTKLKNQLDLHLGVALTRKLGWTSERDSPIYPVAWTSYLVLLAEDEFVRAQRQDFTGGRLNL